LLSVQKIQLGITIANLLLLRRTQICRQKFLWRDGNSKEQGRRVAPALL
jgi:hypothetical protein